MENKELVPVIEIVDGKIQNNLDELETRVKEIAEQHSGLIVDGIPEAKKTVANLRKLYSEINSQKIAAKEGLPCTVRSYRAESEGFQGDSRRAYQLHRYPDQACRERREGQKTWSY